MSASEQMQRRSEDTNVKKQTAKHGRDHEDKQ